MRLLHLMNASCSNFSSLSLVLSGRNIGLFKDAVHVYDDRRRRNILPAVLNICSSGAEEAGTDNTAFAVRATCVKSEACDFHQAKGSSSYSSVDCVVVLK